MGSGVRAAPPNSRALALAVGTPTALHLPTPHPYPLLQGGRRQGRGAQVALSL